jgi:hypothetical protein
MQREVLRPEIGRPLIVKLDYSDPVQREGQYGVDYQYTVNDNAGIMWLPKEAKEAIERAGARAGDEIAITKGKQGKRNTWQVDVVEDEPAPAQQPRRAPSPQTQRQQTRGAAARAAEASDHPGESWPLADTWVMCLRNAAIALTRFRDEAKPQGFEFEFSSDDVRSLATTTFINFCKQGGQR